MSSGGTMATTIHLPCNGCRTYFATTELTEGRCKSCYRPPPPPVPEVKWDDTCPVLKALLEGLVTMSDGAFTGSGRGGLVYIGDRDAPGRRYIAFRLPTSSDYRRKVEVDMTEAEYESFRRWCDGRGVTFQEYT